MEKKNIKTKVTYVTYGKKCVNLNVNQRVQALYWKTLRRKKLTSE